MILGVTWIGVDLRSAGEPEAEPALPAKAQPKPKPRAEPAPAAKAPEAKKKPEPEKTAAADAAKGADVVSLDSFRKK